MKTALITGITGQDGSYLAELLLKKGFDVHGIVRRGSTINTTRIDHLFPPDDMKHLHYGDLADANSIVSILTKIQPDEIYNIGSMSHVKVSFHIPEFTGQVTGLGATRILETLRALEMSETKYYQASSSEMFGVSPPPQNENTPFQPQSPYGIAKLYAYWMTKAYRKGYKMFACNGILFNHESERRGETFVTKKIVRAAVRIKLGLQNEVRLGNLNAMRDWGHAKDYVEAIYKIMHHDVADDFVVATEQHHTIKEFVDKTFDYLNLNSEDYIIIDNIYFRPTEVPDLLGDSTKIRETLGWKPKIDFDTLIKIMTDSVMAEEKIKLKMVEDD